MVLLLFRVLWFLFLLLVDVVVLVIIWTKCTLTFSVFIYLSIFRFFFFVFYFILSSVSSSRYFVPLDVFSVTGSRHGGSTFLLVVRELSFFLHSLPQFYLNNFIIYRLACCKEIYYCCCTYRMNGDCETLCVLAKRLQCLREKARQNFLLSLRMANKFTHFIFSFSLFPSFYCYFI